MAFIPIERTSCLDSAINIDRLSGVMFTQENEAHQFVITCTQNNAQLTLTGTITAKVVLANGNTVELVGTIDGGKAVVTLTQPCYNTAGRIQISIFNTVGSTKLCIYAAIAYVQTAEHGDLIDGSQIIDSVEDLIADIQAAVATIPPDYSTLSNQVADLKSALNYLASTKTYARIYFNITNNTQYKFLAAPSVYMQAGTIIKISDSNNLYNVYLRGSDNVNRLTPDMILNSGFYQIRLYKKDQTAFDSTSVFDDIVYVYAQTQEIDDYSRLNLNLDGAVIGTVSQNNKIQASNTRIVQCGIHFPVGTTVECTDATYQIAVNLFNGTTYIDSTGWVSKYTIKNDADVIIAIRYANNTTTFNGSEFEQLSNQIIITGNKVNITSIDVTSFGALGDYATDDSGAIQAAIDYAHDNGYSEVVFPAKNGYYLDTSVKLHSGITYKGYGTHIKGNKSCYHIMRNYNIDASGYAGDTNIVIDGLYFDLSNTASTDKLGGIGLAHTTGCTIKNCEFVGRVATENHSIDAPANRDLLIINNRFIDCGTNSDIQIDAAASGSLPVDATPYLNEDETRCFNVTVKNNTAIDCENTLVHLHKNGHANVIVEGNTYTGANGKPLVRDDTGYVGYPGNKGIRIINNNYNSGHTDGHFVVLQSGIEDSAILHNVVNTNGAGIYVLQNTTVSGRKSKNVVISNNIIVSKRDAVSLQYVEKSIVSENVLSGNTPGSNRYPINEQASGCNKNLFIGNIFSGWANGISVSGEDTQSINNYQMD